MVGSTHSSGTLHIAQDDTTRERRGPACPLAFPRNRRPIATLQRSDYFGIIGMEVSGTVVHDRPDPTPKRRVLGRSPYKGYVILLTIITHFPFKSELLRNKLRYYIGLHFKITFQPSRRCHPYNNQEFVLRPQRLFGVVP